MPAKWIAWNQVANLIPADDAGRMMALVERLIATAVDAVSVQDFFRQQLPEMAAELGVTGAGVMERPPEWITLAHSGRWSEISIPKPLLADVLDKDSGVATILENTAKDSLIAVPLRVRAQTGIVLTLTGRTISEDVLPLAFFLGRAIGGCLDVIADRHRLSQRIDRLRSILKISHTLSSIRETQPLLESIAFEATRLLDCDRASIFLWDREHHEVIACPALGVAGDSLRLSDKIGIVGDVIHTAKPLRIDDAYNDARFHRKVDQASGYKTRNLLCIPLLDGDNTLLGAFEVINKNSGVFTAEDEITLLDLSTPAAVAVQNTRERELLLRSHHQLTEQVTKGASIIGQSQAMQAMRSTICRLAETNLPVLILGESGTGKEVVAQSLHYQGPRAQRPFIAVNCAAITETLLESELFGHEKGAFTDAHEMHRGKFEIAEGGTLLLDEIGDMSSAGQAKLLRVLEQKVITRVGGSQTIPINVRVLAATNAHLADAVRSKKFREDLYFRLNVVTLELPPLRNRADDILPLAEYFLKGFAVPARRPLLQLSVAARQRLQVHTWPGNVRELRNLMERVAFLAPHDTVDAEDLAFILSPEENRMHEPSLDFGLGEATIVFQQEFIRRAIKRVRNNMSEAARLLGLHRSNLYRKMGQLGMSEVAGREDDDSNLMS